jgi:hypothetical protein
LEQQQGPTRILGAHPSSLCLCAARTPLLHPVRGAQPSSIFSCILCAARTALCATRSPHQRAVRSAHRSSTRSAQRAVRSAFLGAHRSPSSGFSPRIAANGRASPARTPRRTLMTRPVDMRTPGAHAHRQRASLLGNHAAHPVRIECAHRSAPRAARPVRVLDAHRRQRHLLLSRNSRISPRLRLRGTHHRCLPEAGSRISRFSVLYAATNRGWLSIIEEHTVHFNYVFPISPLLIFHPPVMAASASSAFRYFLC